MHDKRRKIVLLLNHLVSKLVAFLDKLYPLFSELVTEVFKLVLHIVVLFDIAVHYSLPVNVLFLLLYAILELTLHLLRPFIC